jgi:hypothetical protein
LGLSIGFVLLPAARTRAQCPGFPAGGALTGVVNSYYAGSTATAGANSLTVSTAYGVRPAGSPAIAAGDLLLIVQMQDAQITSSNTECYGNNTDETGGGCTASGSNGSGANNQGVTGRFEYVIALGAIGAGVAGCTAAAGKVCILGAGASNGLLFSYSGAARTGTRGQRTFQVIRVRQYSTATLTSGLTAYAWDGRVGGVLAVDVSGQLTLGGASVSVDALGFRGGRGQQLGGVGSGAANSDYRNSISTSTSSCNLNRVVHGTKGEGTAGTPRQLPNAADDAGTVPGGSTCDGYPNGERARGAPGNAGGGGADGNTNSNDQNSGGGGGGNGGAGGQGGRSFFSNLDVGGFGGAAFPATLGATPALVLGGGGGSGTRNNTPGIIDAASGGIGGGIIMIRAGSLSGSATLSANGGPGQLSDNDGGGGGGAGGSIVVLTASGSTTGLTLNARGGNGGDAWPGQTPDGDPGERHGPGGGGGGGVIFTSGAPTATSVTGGTRGITTTASDPFGATSGANGLVSSTAVPTDTPGVQTCITALRASLLGLRVSPGTLEFATASQRGTVGFNVYLEHKGARTRLNDALLASPLRDTSAPVLYSLRTGVLATGRLWLEELQTDGRARLLGPFELDDEELAAAFVQASEQVAAAPLGLVTRREHTGRTHSGAGDERAASSLAQPSVEARALKIEVASAGTVELTFADLQAAGIPAAAAQRPERLRLSNLGRPVAFTLTKTGLRFRTERLATDYTGLNPYVLAWAALPARSPVALTRSGPALEPGFLRIEQDVLYAPFVDRAADPWIWDVVSAAATAGPYTFDLPGYVATGGTLPVRVALVGGSEHRHSVQVEINGSAAGTLAFTGPSAALLVGEVPAAVLRASGNELRLSYAVEADTAPDNTGIVFFDKLDLGLTLPPSDAPASVVRVAPFEPDLVVPAQSDYVIISHPLFLDAARRVQELKTAEGHSVAVVNLEQVYDRHAAGVVEANAIRALLADLARRTRLRYVLLLGDDSFDPRDHSGAGQSAFVPSLDGWDGIFGRVPSENRYADIDGDGRPELRIGRLPARTLAEAHTLVDKLAGQREMLRRLQGRQLFAVDNQGPGDLSFRNMADNAAALLPQPALFADLAHGVAPARALLLAHLRAGLQITHYFGHAGPQVWADEGLLRASDAASLEGSGVSTLLFTWACEAQWYRNDSGPSLSEALLLVPNGGAFAAVGPTGISQPRLQAVLSQAVYRHFLAGVPLGESVRRAKVELTDLDPAAGAVVDGWSLLGDPALRLEVPASGPRLSTGVR